jgi:hypothetical protein
MQLQIYPSWRTGEQGPGCLIGAFQRLRDFYSRAAAQGQAISTCLV